MADDNKDLLIFERASNDERLIVVINNSTQMQSIDIPELKEKRFKDLISLKTYNAGDKPTLAGKSGLILEIVLSN